MTNFLLGFLFALAVLAWSLASVKRLRSVARFLEAAAEWGQPTEGRRHHRRVVSRTGRNPGSHPHASEREQDVTDALVALKVPRRYAARAAAAAIAKLDPSATFDDHFRAAVGIAKETA
jgi:hypothetical protein